MIEKLIDYINREIEQLNNCQIHYHQELEFFDTIIKKYENCEEQKYEAYYSISNSDFLLACILQDFYINRKRCNFNEIINDINQISCQLNSLKGRNTLTIIKYILDLEAEEKTTIINNDNLKIIVSGLQNIISKYKCLNAVKALAIFLKDKMLIDETVTFYNDSFHADENKQNTALNKKLVEILNTDAIFDALKRVRDWYIKKNKIITEDKKSIIKKFRRLLEALKNNKNIPVIQIDEDLEEYMSEEGIIILKTLIANNIMAQYESKKARNNELEAELAMDHIDYLLLNYHILGSSLTSKAKDLLMKISKEDLTTFLDTFIKNGLSLIENLNNGLSTVIAYANISTILDIFALCEQGIINLSFIEKNLGIFIEDGVSQECDLFPQYNTLMANISIFKKFNPDFASNKFYHPEMLLDIPDEVEKQRTLLNKYRHGISITNCQFLVSPCIFDLLDYFIENNYDIRMLNNADILRAPINFVIKRLEIMKSIEPNMTEELILSCFNRTSYFPNDEELDEYLINDGEKFSNPDYNRLLSESFANVIDGELIKVESVSILNQKYQLSNLSAYDIGGIIISRPKVLRYVTILLSKYGTDNIDELIFCAIIYGKFLNEDEIGLIKRSLNAIGLCTKARTNIIES